MLTPEASNNKEEPAMDYRSPTIHSSKLIMAGSSMHAQALPSHELMMMTPGAYRNAREGTGQRAACY